MAPTGRTVGAKVHSTRRRRREPRSLCAGGVSLRSRALGDLTQQAHDASLEANNKEHDFSSYCEGGQLPVFNMFVSGTHIFPRASCILSDKQWQSFVNVYI